jgi:hypothetical protein
MMIRGSMMTLTNAELRTRVVFFKSSVFFLFGLEIAVWGWGWGCACDLRA